MKKLIVPILALFCAPVFATAQELVIPEGFEMVDSVIYRPVDVLDSSLVSKSIFSVLSSGENASGAVVNVHQSSEVRSGMDRYIGTNPSKQITGYRIRIFFDNKQNARNESEAVKSRFEKQYPGIVAYRSFVNPYFKVTVGDFRTKSEAMRTLQRLVSDYPAAFVVKENIKYPALDKNNEYIVDTVMVLRPVRDKAESKR